MSDKISTPSKTQQEFIAWYEAETRKGLSDIRFFPGDTWQATLDEFIGENKAIDKAVQEGKHVPFPEEL